MHKHLCDWKLLFGDKVVIQHALVIAVRKRFCQSNCITSFLKVAQSTVHACVFPFVATSTMPDIAKSDISPNLDRDKMFNELWWLNYCFCEGVGIGAVGNPFFGGEAVNICLHSKCASADW